MKRIDDWQVINAMQTAIIDGEEALTYQELDERVEERADILARIPQKVIIAPMSNDLDQLINFLALIRADRVAVPVNAGHSDQGLQEILNQFEDPLVLTDIHSISEKAGGPLVVLMNMRPRVIWPLSALPQGRPGSRRVTAEPINPGSKVLRGRMH